MQTPSETSHARAKRSIAVVLTFAAGIVDIVGYMTVYHLFVAHMTGTTVHFGNKLELGEWPDAVKAATVLASFVLGSVVGRAIIESGARRGKRTVASITMTAEAALVLTFLWIGSFVLKQFAPDTIPVGTACLLLAVLAAAMGLQTATLTRIGPLTIHTTFVTGMLNKLAQETARWLFWFHDSWTAHRRLADVIAGSGKHKAFRNALFMAGIWMSYMMGSIAGTWMDVRWKVAALYLPVVLLIVSIAVDQVRPLSLEEENDQS